MKTTFDINKSPMVVAWEIAPTGNHGAGRGVVHGRELSTVEGQKLLDEIAGLQPAVFVFVGENVSLRKDLCELVHCAARLGLHPMLAASGATCFTGELLADLKNSGLWRLQLTLNGSTAELHDSIEAMPGSFARTLDALQWACTWRIPLQINTNITTRNAHDLEALVPLLKSFRIQLWNVAFPVPRDVNHANDLPSPAEFEAIFARLHQISLQVPFKVKTSEAPHYRRYLLQQRTQKKSGLVQLDEGIPGIMPVHEGRATVFIASDGEVYAGPCLPVPAGNVRFQRLADIYHNSEVFTSLRNPSLLSGKCGSCNFGEICGGSRGRALAMLGDMFTEDVSCIYRPSPPTRNKTRAKHTQQKEALAMEEAG